MSSNTVRIAKNTLMLYFRQILIMLVSLYTVRVVLNTLGAEDYGIYSVVAGVVTMFGFLSTSMATATQRYLSFELGRNDFEQLKRVFSLSLFIYVLIALIIVLLAETTGLWFVSSKLAIPPERKSAALWVYQFSILSFLFTILTSPYMAAIIAHEDMNIYACVSILEVILKLGIVFILQLLTWDKLKLYGILICIITLINTVVYKTICRKKYRECTFSFYWNKDFFKDIMSYTGWSLFGSVAWICKNQGINVLLNQFFNPVIVASRGIASQVSGAVTGFSSNFANALGPQIIKSYAGEKTSEMLHLMFRGIKGTYFLMYIFTLPLLLEMPVVLSLWLKNIPEYTVLFTRLVLIESLINSVSNPTSQAIQATGHNKMYQSVIGSIFLLNLPVSLIALVFGAPAYFVLIISVIITEIAVILRLFILRHLVAFSIMRFFREVLLPIVSVSILAAILPMLLFCLFKQSILRLCMMILLSIISTGICIYTVGFDGIERNAVKNIILNKIRKN